MVAGARATRRRLVAAGARAAQARADAETDRAAVQSALDRQREVLTAADHAGAAAVAATATQGFPLALAWTRARGDSGPVPTWTRGVSFQETCTGHNIDAAALDVDAMQSWIDTVIAGDEAL
jgi:hypothetical protein